MDVLSLLRIAGRNLLRNRRRSAITLLAMFVAVTLMVIMRGSLNGIDQVLPDILVNAQVGALQVQRAGARRSIIATPLELDVPADAPFLSRLRGSPHVRAVAPRIRSGGIMSAHDRSVYAGFIAIDPVEESKVCSQRFADLATGAPVKAESPTGSDLTQALLTRLGSRLGERVALLASDRDGVLNAVEVEVTGTLSDAGLFAAEKKTAFVPLSAAQELLRMPGRATELAVSVDDLTRVDEVAAGLRATLGPEFEVATWREFARFDEDASRAREQSGTWLTSILLLVALLGITNTTLMSVRERTREIGTMMALGMRRRHILGLFLGEATLLALCGGLLGALVGWALVHHFEAAGIRLRVEGGTSTFVIHPFITATYLIRILIVAALSAAAAAFYPALRASRLRPIEALSQVAT